ncbi:hypothetical protein EVAR_21490_1 [Eumeta japonica]|uniref:Uncharacterized protein n=1 Tax=Eumeta variegata TaxID=151549 RepID=A0A4C1UY94_EUMVA|nr:hypothetical protein EVAR_21490_1 [Eumeta japonica]
MSSMPKVTCGTTTRRSSRQASRSQFKFYRGLGRRYRCYIFVLQIFARVKTTPLTMRSPSAIVQRDLCGNRRRLCGQLEKPLRNLAASGRDATATWRYRTAPAGRAGDVSDTLRHRPFLPARGAGSASMQMVRAQRPRTEAARRAPPPASSLKVFVNGTSSAYVSHRPKELGDAASAPRQLAARGRADDNTWCARAFDCAAEREAPAYVSSFKRRPLRMRSRLLQQLQEASDCCLKARDISENTKCKITYRRKSFRTSTHEIKDAEGSGSQRLRCTVSSRKQVMQDGALALCP